MGRWILTGSFILDRVLEGGLPPGTVTLLYGEAETGKTSLVIQCAVNSARLGYKTFLVDTDGAFSAERLSQIAGEDLEEVAERIIVVNPLSFSEQAVVVDDLEMYMNERFGLIAIDTITSLYRSELTKDKAETYRMNRELNRQIATLTQTAKTFNVPLLLTSQVRSVLTPREGSVSPVATRVLKYWAHNVVSLVRTSQQNVVRAKVEKSGGKERNIAFNLVISQDGVHDYDQ